MIKSIAAILSLLIATTPLVRAEDDIRSGVLKDCYLYSWGKGPNWTVKVPTEFRLSLLNRQMPYVDDQYSDPTEKALTWIQRTMEPTTSTLATVDGRKVIQVIYPETGRFGKTIGMILLAIETARDTDWYSPFFAAQPELYRGQFVTGRDVPFGYIATLEWSGTGSLRTHLLYDLRQPHPVILKKLNAGRLARNEFKTDREYDEALKNFMHEADLLSGILPSAKGSNQSKAK